jgi:hypothetical protein
VRRRHFPVALHALGIAQVGSAALAQPRLPLIAVLIHGKESALRSRLDGLSEGLRELG